MISTSDNDHRRFKALTTWTPDMDRVLCEMFRNGKSASIIGEHFGVTKNSIIGRSKRLREKGQLPPLTAEMKAYKQAVGTAARVAKQMGAIPKTVKPVAPRLFTYKPQPKPVTPLPKQEVVVAGPLKKSHGENAAILMNIRSNGCRWIADNFRWGQGDKVLMCGDPKQEDSAFCSHHHTMAYVPQTYAERAKKQRSLLRTGQWAGKR